MCCPRGTLMNETWTWSLPAWNLLTILERKNQLSRINASNYHIPGWLQEKHKLLWNVQPSNTDQGGVQLTSCLGSIPLFTIWLSLGRVCALLSTQGPYGLIPGGFMLTHLALEAMWPGNNPQSRNEGEASRWKWHLSWDQNNTLRVSQPGGVGGGYVSGEGSS